MSKTTSTHITWHDAEISHESRESALGQRGCVLWFTGLSGAGKSTLARRVERLLIERGAVAYVLDGDNLRHGLNRDLGFSPADRAENIRRVGAVAQLFADAGILCLTAFISPYRADRRIARDIVPEGRFIEVYVATSLQACEERDPKGLYAKARAGEIKGFTGIDAPYEEPESAELTVMTEGRSIDDCAHEIIDHLVSAGMIDAANS